MPKELTNKQQAFCQAIEDSTNKTTFNNGVESARFAGYKGNDRTLAAIASENLTKPNIKRAIDEKRAERQAKVNYGYSQACLAIDQQLLNLKPRAGKGEVQAIAAVTALLREKNAITGLHKQTIQHKGEPMPEYSQAERQALTDLARSYKLRLASEEPDELQGQG